MRYLESAGSRHHNSAFAFAMLMISLYMVEMCTLNIIYGYFVLLKISEKIRKKPNFAASNFSKPCFSMCIKSRHLRPLEWSSRSHGQHMS